MDILMNYFSSDNPDLVMWIPLLHPESWTFRIIQSGLFSLKKTQIVNKIKLIFQIVNKIKLIYQIVYIYFYTEFSI